MKMNVAITAHRRDDGKRWTQTYAWATGSGDEPVRENNWVRELIAVLTTPQGEDEAHDAKVAKANIIDAPPPANEPPLFVISVGISDCHRTKATYTLKKHHAKHCPASVVALGRDIYESIYRAIAGARTSNKK